jgi:hypothetical protein
VSRWTASTGRAAGSLSWLRVVEEVGGRRGPGSVRAAQWGCGGDGFGLDDSVRVAVADHLQVEVVGRSSG